MKFAKIFMALAVASAFVACSEDEESWNKNEATVSMAKETMKVSEATGLFNVPVAVTGERNGNVKVTVEVTADATSPAVDDKNYLVTTKTVVISPDQAQGKIEIKTVDDDEINENRIFTVTIVKVEGATLNEASKATTVTIKDNDAAFYEKFAGKWKFNCLSGSAKAAKSWDVTVYTANDEDDPDYNKYMYVTGIMGYAWTMATLQYDLDPETKKITLSIVNGTNAYAFAEGVDFGLGGTNEVYLFTDDGENYSEGLVTGQVSDDLKTVTFDPESWIYGLIFSGADFTGYTWFGLSGITMTR